MKSLTFFSMLFLSAGLSASDVLDNLAEEVRRLKILMSSLEERQKEADQTSNRITAQRTFNDIFDTVPTTEYTATAGLFGAIAGCSVTRVLFFLKEGAHVDVVDWKRRTPLEYAEQRYTAAQDNAAQDTLARIIYILRSASLAHACRNKNK